MATCISLTPAQEQAFSIQARGLVARIKEGDREAYEELVDLAKKVADEPEENGGFLSAILDEAIEALKAVKAQAVEQAEVVQQEAEQETEARQKKSKEEIQAELREKVARAFENRAFLEAAQAMRDFDPDSTDGGKLATIARILKRDIGSSEIYDLYERVAWKVHYLARDLARELAQERALFFIGPLLRVWTTLNNDRASEQMLQGAECVLERARRSEEWKPWALIALEEAIRADVPEIAYVLKEKHSSDLATEVMRAGEDNRAASALIDGLRDRIPGLVAQHRQTNAREKAVKETARRARQMERNQNGPVGRSGEGTDKHGPRKDLGKRAVNDPKFRGRKK